LSRDDPLTEETGQPVNRQPEGEGDEQPVTEADDRPLAELRHADACHYQQPESHRRWQAEVAKAQGNAIAEGE